MGTVRGVRALSIPHERLALIGMMGTGKTTVGQMLAIRLDWGFWDNDVALRAATGERAFTVWLRADGRGRHRTSRGAARATGRSPRTPKTRCDSSARIGRRCTRAPPM